MKDLLPKISEWGQIKMPFAIARVISTWRSSPCPVGSSMIISQKLDMAGSVSGGCVEKAVIEKSQKLINQGGGKKITFNVTDEDARLVGLICGGQLQVFVQKFMAFSEDKDQRELWNQLQQHLIDNKSCVLVTKLIGVGEENMLISTEHGRSYGSDFSDEVKKEAWHAYEHRRHQTVVVEGIEYFVHIFPRRSRLLIIGATHITVDLVQLGKLHDFEVVVIDPRSALVKKTQWVTRADQMIEKYPSDVLGDFDLDVYTFAVVLSHDPTIDDNALEILLPSKVAYIGALGSRKTHDKRVDRLTKLGFSEQLISRIHAPIGVDIHALNSKEIALSIMGEVIKVKNV